MKKSMRVAGRKLQQDAFKKCLEHNKRKHAKPLCYAVTSYLTIYGDRFYADPSYIGPRDGIKKHNSKGIYGPRYRVIVTPKRVAP